MIIARSVIISDLKSPDISFQGRIDEGGILRSFFKNPRMNSKEVAHVREKSEVFEPKGFLERNGGGDRCLERRRVE